MGEMVYQYKPGCRLPVKAEIAGKEIERVRTKKGNTFKPADLVDASRPVRAPLHKVFEWDDAIAAEEYRNQQAGQIVRAVVVIRDGEEPENAVRAFVSVETEDMDGPAYTSIDYAMTDAQMREYVLQSFLRDLKAFEKRYRNLVEYAELFSVIRRTTRKLNKSEGRVGASV